MEATEKNQQKNNGFSLSYVIISIIVSLILHVLLIEGTGSMSFTMPGVERNLNDYEQIDSFAIELKTAEISELLPERQDREPVHLSDDEMKAAFGNSDNWTVDVNPKVEQIFAEADLFEPASIDITVAGIQKKRPQQESIDTPNNSLADMPVAGTPAVAPRPEIVEIEYQNLSNERQNLPGRYPKEQLERNDIPDFDLPSLAQPGTEIVAAHNSANSIHIKSSRPNFANPDNPDFLNENGGLANGNDGIDAGSAGISASDNLGNVQGFDSFVNVRVSIFPEQNSSAGYYEIAIAPNNRSGALKDIPKDLLFIIDRSTSISEAKLRQFKLAVCNAIGYLHSTDRFNIVYFNDKCDKVFKAPMVPATGQNIQNAIKAVSGIRRGGRTDVFGGLAPFVTGAERDSSRPYNIFIMTDGQSTVNIFKSSDFLTKITSLNQNNVSIFPFSAGKDANRQLLDYLGYLNRGGKYHVDNIEDIQNALTTFIITHSNMVIRDLHYTTNENFSQEIYPKALPHLYRNDVLKLYGRYNNVNNEIVITITGYDASGNQRDFVLRKKLNQCQFADETLPLEWAAQKILWLNARKHCSADPAEINALNQEIAKLRTDFRVYVPEGEE